MMIGRKKNTEDVCGTTLAIEPLGWMARGEFELAPFHREDSWTIDDRRSYIAALFCGKSFDPPIVLYFLEDFGPVYLADGLARLEALRDCLVHPRDYGFPHREAAWDALCRVTMRHVRYRCESHDQAYHDFYLRGLMLGKRSESRLEDLLRVRDRQGSSVSNV